MFVDSLTVGSMTVVVVVCFSDDVGGASVFAVVVVRVVVKSGCSVDVAVVISGPDVDWSLLEVLPIF